MLEITTRKMKRCQPPPPHAEDLPHPTVLSVPAPADGQNLVKLLPCIQCTRCWKQLAAFLQQRKCPTPTSERQALSPYKYVLKLVVSWGKKYKCNDHTWVQKDAALALMPDYKKQHLKIVSSPLLPYSSLSDPSWSLSLTNYPIHTFAPHKQTLSFRWKKTLRKMALLQATGQGLAIGHGAHKPNLVWNSLGWRCSLSPASFPQHCCPCPKDAAHTGHTVTKGRSIWGHADPLLHSASSTNTGWASRHGCAVWTSTTSKISTPTTSYLTSSTG